MIEEMYIHRNLIFIRRSNGETGLFNEQSSLNETKKFIKLCILPDRFDSNLKANLQ